MTILHLEDSRIDAALVRNVLQRGWPDCRINHALDRPQFERALELGGLDVILCDYALPGFDGLAALNLAQRFAPETPFIFVSGTIGEERAIEAMQHGAADYILKDRLGRLIPAIQHARSRIESIVRRRQTEEELKQSDERLREQASLLDKARDAIIATDISLRIAYWNSSAERLFGWTSAEVFGRRLDELGLGYAPARFAEAKARVLAAGEWRGDFTLVNREGAGLHVETTWSLVLGGDGQPRSILIIDTDVTERKKLEMQLLRADRMDSIGMLAGGVAHDLNNVLTPILMGAELLRMRATDPQDLRILENIESSAAHGSALVKQLLAFARGSEGVRSEVRIDGLIEDIRRLLRQSLARSITIEIVKDPDVPVIHADATQMKQVLLNLSFNARDAMPQGGQLEIRCTNATVDAALARRHPGVEPGPFLRIAIKDNGNGMPPEVLRKVFDPFFTTKAGGRGTGLGLSTVAGIVKSHGGFLTVESAVGRGTVFELYFPADRVPAPAPTRSSVPFVIRGHGERILVIDEDAQVRETFNFLLEKSGYAVIAVPDAPRAIEEFQQRNNIAVIVTELKVGGFRGAEIVRALRGLRPRQPIIAISALADPESVEALRAATPPVEILAKPISAETLLLALRRATTAAR